MYPRRDPGLPKSGAFGIPNGNLGLRQQLKQLMVQPAPPAPPAQSVPDAPPGFLPISAGDLRGRLRSVLPPGRPRNTGLPSPSFQTSLPGSAAPGSYGVPDAPPADTSVAASGGQRPGQRRQEREEARAAQSRENFDEWVDPNSPFGGSRNMLRKLRTLQVQLARLGYPGLLEAIGQLNEQANTDRFSPEERASFLAPYLERFDDEETRAWGDLQRSLAERGLDTSSFGAAVQGSLASQSAGQRAGIVRELFERERQRQLQAQQMRREFLAALLSGSTQRAAALGRQLFDQRITQEQLNQANDFDLGSLLNAGLQLYGMSRRAPGASAPGGLGGGMQGGWPSLELGDTDEQV